MDDEDGDIIKTADELAHQVAYIQQQRPDLMIPYKIAIIGKAYTKGWSVVEAYNSPGGSWCLEILAPLLGSHEEMSNRVRSGPPKE